MGYIGAGNFGEVKKVLVNGVVYAAKKLVLGRDQEFLNREYRNLLQFQSPDINELIYADGVTLYLKFAELGTFKDLPSLNFSREEVLECFIQIARALANIHDQEYRHADVKSVNIFLTHSKEAKLGDFGSLTSAIEDQTETSGVQRRKKSPADLKKIDTVSFGGVLWDFISSVPPSKISYYDPQNTLKDLMDNCIKARSFKMTDALRALQEEKKQAITNTI